MAIRAERPAVPEAWVRRIDDLLSTFGKCAQEPAWAGTRWRVGSATVAHVFGGEDQLFRIIFRADADEVIAFENMGTPYFKVGWGRNVVGMILDDRTDWDEVAELLTDSYCLQAPSSLAELVARPGRLSP